MQTYSRPAPWERGRRWRKTPGQQEHLFRAVQGAVSVPAGPRCGLCLRAAALAIGVTAAFGAGQSSSWPAVALQLSLFQAMALSEVNGVFWRLVSAFRSGGA